MSLSMDTRCGEDGLLVEILKCLTFDLREDKLNMFVSAFVCLFVGGLVVCLFQQR